MTNDEAPEFIGRLMALGELFNADLSASKQALYFEALKDLSLFDVQHAINEAVKTCTFMPKPAELRILAVGDPQEFGEQAWIAFRAAARRLGAYQDWMPDEPEIACAVIDVFGNWPRACEADLSPEMWASKRKEFINSCKRNYLKVRNTTYLLSGQLSIDRGQPALKTVADLAQLESGQ